MLELVYTTSLKVCGVYVNECVLCVCMCCGMNGSSGCFQCFEMMEINALSGTVSKIVACCHKLKL